MNKRSVLRTIMAAAVFALLMSIAVWADAWGPQIQLATSVKDTEITATDDTMLHKLVVPRDGMVIFTGVKYSNYSGDASGLTFSLLMTNYVAINRYGNSSTYVDGSNKNSSSFSRAYALKKGTYYIRVTGTKNYKDYTIRTKFMAVNDQGNTVKKKKGTTLKKKATMTALFGASERNAKTEWFKFKLKKPKKVTLTAGAYGDASYRVTFYGPKPYKKGDTFYVSSGYTKSYKYWIQKGRKKLKLKKGTYYIRIQRSSNDVSGYCTIQWK